MSKFTSLKIASVTFVAASSLQAATSFTNNGGAGDGDLNTAANWTNGLPSLDNPGTTTADGSLSSNFGNAGAQGANDEDFFINSNIMTSNNTLAIGGSADRLFIGDGTFGSLTVEDGGALTAIGASQDVRIGVNGGSGQLIFENGSSIDTRKAMQVFNGLLEFGSDVTTLQNGIQNDFLVGATSILRFQVASDFASHTIQGNTVPMIFEAGADIDLVFGSTPTVGQTFKLVDDVESYSGTADITGTGLAPGQSLELTYGLGTDGLVATVIPEPSSAMLLGLGAFGLILRRRK